MKPRLIPEVVTRLLVLSTRYSAQRVTRTVVTTKTAIAVMGPRVGYSHSPSSLWFSASERLLTPSTSRGILLHGDESTTCSPCACAKGACQSGAWQGYTTLVTLR
ncbi:hypothetical protein FOIG_16761 [Fusarium odoratissimum NRRL 54006]|uniref:Uncharacterized protein n=1 Tax=Fusarium odoratissimum (strain NRRL 54006) TaxID=1089451 RepID=X0JYL9_FUSO5|nr:uncharacterized protein FOIG_16761 [Fusarium odoratissimum NRRL 54006]EXL89959.1 hypothetical protein FOIG_16761 [Fusarium odoratissimum NRRL 54006]